MLVPLVADKLNLLNCTVYLSNTNLIKLHLQQSQRKHLIRNFNSIYLVSNN